MSNITDQEKITDITGIVVAVQGTAKEFNNVKSRGVCINELWYEIDYISNLVEYDKLFETIYVKGNKITMQVKDNKKIISGKVISKNNTLPISTKSTTQTIISTNQSSNKTITASYHDMLLNFIAKAKSYKMEHLDTLVERDLPIMSKHTGKIENHTVIIVKVRVTITLANEETISVEAIGDASAANVSAGIAPSIIRMAETRGYSRAFRSILGEDTAKEEM